MVVTYLAWLIKKIARRTIGAKGCKINESIIRFQKFNWSLNEIRIQFQCIMNGFFSVYLF